MVVGFRDEARSGLNVVSNVVRSTGGYSIEYVGGATTIASNDVVNVRDYPMGRVLSYYCDEPRTRRFFRI